MDAPFWFTRKHSWYDAALESVGGYQFCTYGLPSSLLCGRVSSVVVSMPSGMPPQRSDQKYAGGCEKVVDGTGDGHVSCVR